MLYVITGNTNKYEEIRAIIPNVEQLDIDLPEIQEIDAQAVIKAKIIEALKYRQDEFIVEDTSLYFECLNGLPGPLIKWFLKTVGTSGLFNIAKESGNCRAEAKTVIGYARSIREIYFFKGSLKGAIVPPGGKKGFGWDEIFQPDGFSRSFAEMSMEEKNSISMRNIAIKKLKEFLEVNN
jgi:inosine triphosphate pyrophosphatase